MDVEEMRRNAADATDFLKTLSNPHRLMALCELTRGELSVGELAERLGVRDQAMSQQLALLRARGFVETRREGQTIYYAIARHDVRQIIESLYGLFCSPQGTPSRKRAPRS